jgi:thymidylate kinase
MEHGTIDDRPFAVHPILTELFAAFDANAIRWCVVRGEAELGDPVGDVDLLVAPDDLPRLRPVLAQLGFAPIPAWGYGPHTFFLTYDATQDRWVKLDVVTELAFGPRFTLRTGAADGCLARRRRIGGVAVPAPDDAFWALLLHRLLDEGAVSTSAATRLAELAVSARPHGPLPDSLIPVCPRGWTPTRIIDCARAGNWAALEALAPELARSWCRRRLLAVGREEARERSVRFAGRFLRRWHRRGLSAAVLAPDGAGKSTLVNAIEHSFYFPARSVYMGMYANGVDNGRPEVPRFRLIGRIVDQQRRWLTGLRHRARGRLVLFDRYGYDALLPPRRNYRRPRKGLARRWLLAHAAPAPNLVVLLDAPGEVLHARKQEQAVSVLEDERQGYLTLVSRLRNATVVDATGGADDVRRNVTAVLWQAYAHRWNRDTVAREKK